MKKVCFLLAVLLCLTAAAVAEEGAAIEVIKVDGVSVVVLTPEPVLRRARGIAEEAQGDEEKDAGFLLPPFLTMIEEEAFAGIAAEKIEVSKNVAAIGARAFADCKNLKEIYIPAGVVSVDDRALEGCEGVTVYGETGSEAQRFAGDNGFDFVDPDAVPEAPKEAQPVELPFIPR